MSLFRQSDFFQIILGAVSLLLAGGLLLTTYHISMLQTKGSELNRLTAEQVFYAEYLSHLSARLLSDPSVDTLWNDLVETKQIWIENHNSFASLVAEIQNSSTPYTSPKNLLKRATRSQEKTVASIDALFLEFNDADFRYYTTIIQQNTSSFSKIIRSVSQLQKTQIEGDIEVWHKMVWWQFTALVFLQLANIIVFLFRIRARRSKRFCINTSSSTSSTVPPISEIKLKHSLNIQKTINDNLRNAKNTAEAISEAKGQFIATLSHEIRNPINAILGLADLLKDSTSPEDHKENLKNLQFSAQHLRALIDNILDLGKIEAKRIELVISSFDLLQTVKGVIQGYKGAAEEKGVDLRLSIDSNLPSQVVGDSLRLSQILNNLVSNAIKFTLQGYIQISLKIIKEEEQTITVNFRVKDTGIGIPQEKLETLFDEFTQVNNGISHKFGGTGLGLTITKKLVELLGGSIEVNSEPDEGTAFDFDIKFEKASDVLPQIGKKDSKKSIQSLTGLSVLVAEDDKLNQVVIRQFLKKWEVQFDLVDNGASAVQFINQKNYDVILMDANMPIMDGVSATSLIRKAGVDTPIIALTGLTNSEFLKELTFKGFTGLAAKPFVPEELFSLLKTYLSTKTETIE